MRDIPLHKDRLWRVRVDRNSNTGKAPLDPSISVRLWLSMTPGGAPIDPTRIVVLARDPANLRMWTATTLKADIDAQLGGLANNTTVHVVVSVESDINSTPARVLSVNPI